jgi:DNA/RNA endonuclease YhcR with UshA esterase domain
VKLTLHDSESSAMRLSCLLFAMISFSLSILTAAEGTPITPAEAMKKVNEKVIVRMVVKSTGGQNNRYLNSEEDFKDAKNFFIFISKEDVEKFKKAGIEKPEEYFKGKTIEVTGTVVVVKEKAQIKADNPAQIKIVEKDKK